jgi:large subunit ribosomal protein L5
MNIPAVQKVVVNMGLGSVLKDGSLQDEAVKALEDITGQKVALTKAKKAIAGFKIREGQYIGARVTLRGEKMWAFIDRLIHIAIPRVRDFHGIDRKSVDQSGNLNFGVKDHTIFPEISAEHARMLFGFQITVVTNTDKREEALALFDHIGFPLKKDS